VVADGNRAGAVVYPVGPKGVTRGGAKPAWVETQGTQGVNMSEQMTNAATRRQEQEAGTQELGGKFLTFGLGEEEFGVQILKVREIIGLMEITAVPQMPSYVKGVINLRGKVIPVMSLRLKFGLPEVADTEQTCVIVVDVGRDVGIVVDHVSEVADISDADIEPAPAVGYGTSTQFILGMGKVNDAVKILLDIDSVVDRAELEQIDGAPATAEAAPIGDATF
jgi:purine-binding chemotaxis protein CheW